MSRRRIAVTGLAINTPLGDTPGGVLDAMLAERSAITRWKGIDTSCVYAKNGGDISSYDTTAKLSSFEGRVPEEVFARARRVFKQVAPNTRLSLLLALDAFADSGLFEHALDPFDAGVVCGGHNLNNSYVLAQHDAFREEPDFIDGLAGLSSLDTDYSSAASEILNLRAMAYSLGGACATGNIALQQAGNALLFEGRKVQLVIFPVLVMDVLQLQELTFLDAIAYQSFAETPEKASRPYDVRREGFVPCEAGAAMVLEDREHARARGARIHAELLGAHANSDANHLGNPSSEGQTRVMRDLLEKCGVAAEEIDYVSAHATSTRLGDVTELRSVEAALGRRAHEVFLNAPKSLMGHPGWSAAGVEAALAIEQMNRGEFHRSCNIDELDPEVDLDVCADSSRCAEVEVFMNNSFGMGGINSASLFRKHHA